MASKPILSEATIEKLVCRWARDHNIIAVKLNGAGDRGKPDRMFLHAGTTAFVEFKRTGGKATALQERWRKTLSEAGFDAEIFDDKEAAIDWLAAIFHIRS